MTLVRVRMIRQNGKWILFEIMRIQMSAITPIFTCQVLLVNVPAATRLPQLQEIAVCQI